MLTTNAEKFEFLQLTYSLLPKFAHSNRKMEDIDLKRYNLSKRLLQTLCNHSTVELKFKI